MTNQNPLTYSQEAKVLIIQGQLRQYFFVLLGLIRLLLVLVIVDFIYHLMINSSFRADFWQLLHIYQSHLETQNCMMATSITAKLRLPTFINWLLIISILMLNRARPKATYNNFAMMTRMFVVMILINMFILIFYRTAFFANGFWYTVFAFPFIALPIHEYQKLKKHSPNLILTDSFLHKLMN